MILGRGVATDDDGIVAEYRQFLADHGRLSPRVLHNVQGATHALRRRLGGPIATWAEADILALCARRRKSATFYYASFLAFLIFRGYYRPSLTLLDAFPFQLPRLHRPALAPIRARLEATARELGYVQASGMGTALRLLIWLLAHAGTPLEDLTREDFATFAIAYQTWYRASGRHHGEPDPQVSRLEFYLVRWDVLPPRRRVFRHEQHFAELRDAPIRDAILAYVGWCTAKYQPSTVDNARAALLQFFRWSQERQPEAGRLDAVTRPVALAYAAHLTERREAGQYSRTYHAELYAQVRQFFAFAIDENLDTAPDRNPFALKDLPRRTDPVPRYLSDREVQAILAYCDHDAGLRERTMLITLLHTGIRAAELAALKTSDIVQVQSVWKLHIHAGKGLKDRVIPLTAPCLAALQAWQERGWEGIDPHLFTWHGRPHRTSGVVTALVARVGQALGIAGLTAHRFRHTFAVALLNYGIRESALQKLMGHATLGMTLEYARILDHTVEQAFGQAIEQMRAGPLSWVPSFFGQEEYTLFAEGDAVSYIRLPHGYCRRNPKLHCESDVKCLLCERYAATLADLPRLAEMRDRFVALGLHLKAEVVAAQIRRLEAGSPANFIPLDQVAVVRRPGAAPTPGV